MLIVFIFLIAKTTTFAAVVINDTSSNVILSNGIISMTIEKSTADVTSIKLQKLSNLEVTSDGGGYFDLNTDSDIHLTKITYKLVRSSSSLAEISLDGQIYSSNSPNELQFNISLHYVIRDSEAGFYVFPVWTHGSGMSATSLAQSRFVLRIDPNIFTQCRNADDHYQTFPLPAWLTSDAEIMDETYLLPNKSFYTKYEWTNWIHADKLHGAWGTSGGSLIGCWAIYGSYEASYGPTHSELIVHQTSTTPVVMMPFQGSHYSYQNIDFTANEVWNKLHGPSFYYFNLVASSSSGDELWNDASTMSSTLESSWPYSWMSNSLYPLKADRGSVNGSISGTSTSGGWAILASPSEPGWRPDWQVKDYTFWSTISSNGQFLIPNVIPNVYNLYIWSPSQFPNATKTNVKVSSGQITQMGVINLSVVSSCGLSNELTIWQIGEPDHTSGEYKHGNDYHHWGMWLNYTKDFPSQVDFTIGKSSTQDDWNYVQPLLATQSQVADHTDWIVRFDVPQLSSLSGSSLCLTVGFASIYMGYVHTDYKLAIYVNNVLGITFPIGSSITESCLVRVGIEGVYQSQSWKLDKSLFKSTGNVMTLNLSATTTTPEEYMPNAGVMYDFLVLQGSQ